MSHYTEQVSAIDKLDTLQKTLQEQGFEVKKDQKTITSSYASNGKKWDVDFAFGKNNRFEVGFKKSADGTYTLVGDAYDMGYRDQKALSKAINLGYGENRVKEIVGQNRRSMRVVSNKTENGKTRMRVEVSVV